MIERKQTLEAAVGVFLILVVAVMAALLLGGSVERLVLSFAPSANLIPDLLPPVSIARLVLLPVVVLAAAAMMILPGALLFAGIARPMDLPATMLAGFGLTTVTVSVVLVTLAAAGIMPTANLYGASCLVFWGGGAGHGAQARWLAH